MSVVQSPIHSLLSMITVRLDDGNYITWSFQLQSLLEGNDLFGFLDGSSACPPQFVYSEDHGITTRLTQEFKDWKKTDRALISLLIATLTPEAMEYVVGCKTSQEAWNKLHIRYATVSSSSIMQLKTTFQTLQKGTDSIEHFLLRISKARDQLSSLGVKIPDEDVVVVALNGLPQEYNMIKTVIKARETPITLQEFRSQLLGAERDVESWSLSLNSLTAMVAKGNLLSSSSGSHQGGTSTNGNNSGVSDGPSNSSPTNSHGNGSNDINGTHRYQNSSNGGTGNGYNNNNYRTGRNNWTNSYNTTNNGNRNWNGRNYNNGGGRNSWNNNRNQNNDWNNSSRHNGDWHNNSRNNGDWNNSSRNNGAFPECQICNKRGHIATTCDWRNSNGQNGASSSNVECQICGKKGHIALDCGNRTNFAYQGQPPPASIIAMSAQGQQDHESQAPNASNQGNQGNNSNGFSADDDWILDTGATHHMTADIGQGNQGSTFSR